MGDAASHTMRAGVCLDHVGVISATLDAGVTGLLARRKGGHRRPDLIAGRLWVTDSLAVHSRSQTC